MKKILVVDDEPDLLKVISARLSGSGYEVSTATTAEKALEFLAQNKPDLILLDLLLPKMQGDEACRIIKSDEKLKNIPVVLFTASVTDVAGKAREMQADAYITKPFETQELLDMVKKFIG